MLPGYGGSFWTLTLYQKVGWVLKTQQATISKIVGCLAGCVNLVSDQRGHQRDLCCLLPPYQPHHMVSKVSKAAWLPLVTRSYPTGEM